MCECGNGKAAHQGRVVPSTDTTQSQNVNATITRIARQAHDTRKALIPSITQLDADPRSPFAAVHTYLDRCFGHVLDVARTGDENAINRALVNVPYAPLKKFLLANKDIAALCHETVLQLVKKALMT